MSARARLASRGKRLAWITMIWNSLEAVIALVAGAVAGSVALTGFGVDSLIEQPALMSYFEKTTEERLAVGIKDNLVRFAVGIEDAADLIADLEQALSA